MFKALLLIFTLLSSTVYANVEAIIDRLKPFFPNLSTEQIQPSQINNFYEVLIHTPQYQVMYISSDARYIIQGEVTDLKTMTNLSSARLAIIKKQILDNILEVDKIIFKARDEKYIIHVFTDVDCPYCAKLHANMAEINALGITVKYLASPLETLHPQAEYAMERIWCSENRNLAMHNYKTQRILPNTERCTNPVAAQLALAQKLGVTGTPSIFFENGTNLPGYQKPNALLQSIRQALAK